MRSVWSLIVMVVVLAGLAGYIFLVENKREPNAAEAKEKLWGGTLASADLEEVQITLAGGETATVQKMDGAWQVVAPSKAPADETEMTSITSSLRGSRFNESSIRMRAM